MAERGDRAKPLLDLELWPQRSAAGALAWAPWLFGALAGLLGLRFLAIGAWPVALFLVADIALVWLAFHFSRRGGTERERVRVADSVLSVERLRGGRPLVAVALPARATRVVMQGSTPGRERLFLVSPQARVPLGDFLSAGERAEVAAQLRRVLAR